MNKIIFIAGIHGVGKSTIAKKLGTSLKLSVYNFGELIPKKIQSKDFVKRQRELTEAAKKIKDKYIVTGHFCLYDPKTKKYDFIPEFVFNELLLEKIILLEGSSKQILHNNKSRKNKTYTEKEIKEFKNNEKKYALYIAEKYKIPIIIYKMKYDNKDPKTIAHLMEEIL